jgi:GT2 family glycosyltransferase
MTLALQLVTFNSSPYLSKLLPALRAQTLQGWTLYVRDHSGKAEEVARIEAALRESGVPFQFEAGENIGFANGHNRLYQQHAAEAVALVNPDLIPEPDYYEQLVGFLADHAGAGSVQGLLLRGQSGDPAVAMIDSLGLELRGLGDIRDGGAGTPAHAYLGSLEPLKIFGVAGAAPVYRRSALEWAKPTHGCPLDERFFLYKEDVELAIRLHRAGYEAFLLPSARSWHGRAVGRTSFRDRVRSEFKRPAVIRVASYVDQWKIYVMHASPRTAWSRLPATVVAEVFRTVALLLSPKLFVRAWSEFFRDFRSLRRSRQDYAKRFSRDWHTSF